MECDGVCGKRLPTLYDSADARTDLGIVAMSKQTSSTSCVGGVEGAFEETVAVDPIDDTECDLDGGRWD